MSGYKKGLIKAALAQTSGMEGDRNNSLGGKFCYFGIEALKKQLRQRLSEVKTLCVFELLHCVL